jgi:glycosyltransferase involved in cell wall biosynthesis
LGFVVFPSRTISAPFSHEVPLPFLTVFTPAYNEEENLPRCIEAILQKVDELGITAEILVIEDGSADRTAQVADRLAGANPRVRVIHQERNQGIGKALVTAIRHARGEWLIFIPADLPLHLSELSRFIEAAPYADVVVGLRSDRSDYNILRKLISYSNIFLIRLLFGMRLSQYQYISMYRMDMLRNMKITCTDSAFFLAEILIRARDHGQRIIEVPILYAPRVSGKPTGAKLVLVIRTIFDLFLFWSNWFSSRSVKGG